MRSVRLLLVLGLLLIGLAGCGRKAPIAPMETSLSAADHQSSAVARAKNEKAGKEEPADGDGFRFSDDKAGALLARVLPPAVDRQALADRAAAPRRLPSPASLESPAVPLPTSVVGLPRARLEPKRPQIRP